MKPASLVLAISLALNAVGVTLLVRAARGTAGIIPKRAEGSSERASAADGVRAQTRTGNSTDRNNQLAKPLLAGVSPGDIGEVIARLRAAGVPAREIVFVVQAMIAEIEQRGQRERDPAYEDRPYWETVGGINPRSQADSFREVMQEVQRLTRQYLYSPELFAANDTLIATQRQRFGPLDIEKLRLLTLLEADRQEADFNRMKTLSVDGAGTRVEFGSVGANPAKNTFDDSVRALLTPDEYREYELRSSGLALSLQSRLGAFRPTEEEYRAIYFFEREARVGMMDSNSAPGVTAAQAAELQRLLGPERAADYEALRQAGGDGLARLMARLDVPLTAIVPINAIRDQANARAQVIRRDRALDATQRAEQLAALAREAEGQLGAIFGDARGLEAYQGASGIWLRNLKQSNP